LAGWTGRPDPSLTYSLLFLKEAYYNTAHTDPPAELTQAINDSRKYEDVEKRKEAFARVQKLAMENALWAPISFSLELDAMSARRATASVMRMSRFSVFCSASTRLASLTAAPITVKSSRSGAPILPKNTSPSFSATPARSGRQPSIAASSGGGAALSACSPRW